MASVDESVLPEDEATEHRAARTGSWLRRLVPGSVEGVVVELGEMARLTGKVVYEGVRNPVGYWGDTRDFMFSMLKRCVLPLFFGVFGFILLVATFAVALLLLLGAPNRVGAVFLVANIRDMAGLITSMVTAGVIGTAITADLGARKIREELDALHVLGMNPIRMFVLPQVIAMTVMAPILDAFAIYVSSVIGNVAVVLLGNASSGAYNAFVFTNLSTTEVWGAVIKMTLIAFLMAVVCAHKGLNSGGGSEGVGRAVNQSVVICFCVIFVVNSSFNATMLGLNPSMQVLR